MTTKDSPHGDGEVNFSLRLIAVKRTAGLLAAG